MNQRVVLSEKILPETNADAESTWIDLVDMTLTGAERTVEQWQKIIDSAGFRWEKTYQAKSEGSAAMELFLK